MKNIFKIVFFTLFTVVTGLQAEDNNLLEQSSSEKLLLSDLLCEYKNNPIGIGVDKPRLSWKITTGKRGVVQEAYQIQVAKSKSDLKNGKDLIWDSKKVLSDNSIHVEYEGRNLKSGEKVYWRVRVWTNYKKTNWTSGNNFWAKGIEISDWKAKWISTKEDSDKSKVAPNPYFRKDFKVAKKVKSAYLYATSLGLYEMQINGKKVGDALFTPGWTSYNKRLQYQTYDVTKMISHGNNAIGAILAEGWYKGNLVWANYRNIYGDRLALLSQLKIEYADGSSELVVSDDSWKYSSGELLYSSIYHGEIYDSNKEVKNWSAATFDSSSWSDVEIIEHTKETLVAQSGPLVKEIQEIKPIKIFTDSKGNVVYDMGQNMVGYVQLSVKGKKGQKITLKHGEILDKDYSFFTANLRSAKAEVEYTLKGGNEILKPKFTFQGFRYVSIKGLNNPKLENITGIVVHSVMKETGTFECSDTLINQLQSNIMWGQKGNFLDVPTDCPQRDERLGWTGDIQVFSPTAAYNMDVAGFLSKWMKDVEADQYETGSVPHIVPDVLYGSDWKNAAGSTGWGDVIVTVPWVLYQAYGDVRILTQQYKNMKAWVDFEASNIDESGIWRKGTNFEGVLTHFGDWLAYSTETAEYPGATTDKDLISTAYYAYSANTLSKIAEVLGNKADEIKYKEQFEKTKKAFRKEFITSSGRLSSNTQTAYVLALSFDLIPDELLKQTASYLASNVESFKHLTTGFLGTPLLMQTLSDIGRDDLAFMLINRKTYPGWLYPVTMGATTIWERWDAQRPDRTFNGDTMNSFNHYAYGAVGSWLYNYVAGLKIVDPAYKTIEIKPTIGGGLTYANTSHQSMYGKIYSGWKVEDDKTIISVEVPVNTKAKIVIPSTGKITLDGKLISKNKYIDNINVVDGKTIFEIGSGTYEFVVTSK